MFVLYVVKPQPLAQMCLMSVNTCANCWIYLSLQHQRKLIQEIKKLKTSRLHLNYYCTSNLNIKSQNNTSHWMLCNI